MTLSSQLAAALHEGWKQLRSPMDMERPGVFYKGTFGGHEAVIEKRGKKKNLWLTFKGKEYDLGKRAKFDHAEGIIKKVLGEGLEEATRQGSYFDQGRIPKEGEKVWALVGQINQKAVQGTVSRADRTYHGGHYHCDVQTAKGSTHRVSTDVMFDHRPKRVKRRDEFGEVTVWESLDESKKSPAWYEALYKKNKGIFWRGEGGKKSSPVVGAIGEGVYVTWEKGMAKAFAQIHGGGKVAAYKLKRGLKMMDAQSNEMAAIKKRMGFGPDEYAGDRMFARVITIQAKELGYDGVASSRLAEGIVVFDPKNVTKVKG
jgi:hypothetical protein